MIAKPVTCVVDASVAIKFVVTEPDSPQAHALFVHLTTDPAARFVVPDLLFVECANILWKKHKRGEITEPEALAAMMRIRALPLEIRPGNDLAERALQLAIKHGATAYDALYVAAADQLTLPLITADDKLVKRFSGSSIQIELLATLVTPAPPTAPSP